MTTNPYYDDGRTVVYAGDCIETMRAMPEASVDAIVTDPPYGLGFMGKEWDALPPGDDFAEQAFRVLKPGGHILAFGGTRTWHRLAVAIEDAGFEIRDSIAWLYGSGFPKSLDVSKAIDKAAGATREVMGRTKTPFKVDAAASRGTSLQGSVNGDFSKQTDEDGYRYTEHTAPATDAARQWQGWGTALKPAFEPIVVGRKPLIGTVAANVLAHGTGALNIDASRIGHDAKSAAWVEKWSGHEVTQGALYGGGVGTQMGGSAAGRFPANVILDESQAAALDEQSGTSRSTKGKPRGSAAPGEGWGMTATGAEYDDTGGASRFFYCPKAPKSERPVVDGVAHPTVKPLALMRYLIRLVTPPGGVVLDPFLGSGTTMEAAILEGFRVTGVELTPDYLPLILARIARAEGV
jgi:hypothetical protein